MDSLNLGVFSGKKEDERRNGFNTAWIFIHPICSCAIEQNKNIWEKHSLIHHCKTIYCYRMTSQSTSTTLEASTTCTPSSNQAGLIPGGKSKRRDRQSVFFTAVNPTDIQCVDMESTMTGIPVTAEPKLFVSGPCWNLNCLNPCPLAVAMMFHVSISWTHSVLVCWGIRVVQACVAVNVEVVCFSKSHRMVNLS